MEKWSTLSIILITLVTGLSLIKPNFGRILLGLSYLVLIALMITDRVILFFSYPDSTTTTNENSLLTLMAILFIGYSLLTAVFIILMAIFILGKHKKVKIGLIGSAIFLLSLMGSGLLIIPFGILIAVQMYLAFKDFDKSFLEDVRNTIKIILH